MRGAFAAISTLLGALGLIVTVVSEASIWYFVVYLAFLVVCTLLIKD